MSKFAKSIPKLALGRVAKIGQFYDAKTDSFIHGMNAFTDSSIGESDNQITKCGNIFIEVIRGDSIDDKCEVFEVDPELKLSVILGLVKLNKSSSYIVDQKKSNNMSQVSLVYSIRTCTQEIRIQNYLGRQINKELLKNVDATHIVVGIDWGCYCSITCEHSVEDSDSKEHVEE